MCKTFIKFWGDIYQLETWLERIRLGNIEALHLLLLQIVQLIVCPGLSWLTPRCAESPAAIFSALCKVADGY
jgi:hypothetical protein